MDIFFKDLLDEIAKKEKELREAKQKLTDERGRCPHLNNEIIAVNILECRICGLLRWNKNYERKS